MSLYHRYGSLFRNFDLREHLEKLAATMDAEIDGIPPNRLLNTPTADLAAYFKEKYSLQPPALRRDEWSASQHEVQVDVSRDGNRWFRDEHRGPFYIPGQRIDIEVPFDGDHKLFEAKPSTFSMSGTPAGFVREGVLTISFEIPHDTERDVKAMADRQLQEIDQHLQWVTKDILGYNANVLTRATQSIDGRKDRLLKNENRVASLGIPLKVRPDAPQTYAAPTIRKKVAPSLPKASTAPFEPEPAMSMEHYEHVLTVIQNMTQVMERSPSTFANMGEEALRDHYLVQLNGQFEGQATGETFNAAGKTDILLRIDGKNVFIGECKLWKGKKVYGDTIDQLLGYSSWRDTKTAILIFNRNRDTSKVLEEIKTATEALPHYKRTVLWSHESGYRFVMHHPADKNRELIMTVLVFDIPEAAPNPKLPKALKKTVK